VSVIHPLPFRVIEVEVVVVNDADPLCACNKTGALAYGAGTRDLATRLVLEPCSTDSTRGSGPV
jgi:hypothetical protein